VAGLAAAACGGAGAPAAEPARPAAPSAPGGPPAAQPAGVLTYSKRARVFNGNKIALSVWSWKDPFEPIFQKYFKQYAELYPNVEF
jgi:hypothetical protein